MSGTDVVITGYGIELPALPAAAAELADRLGVDDLRVRHTVQNGAFAPALVLGRQGLKYKDRATKLSLCVASHALNDAGLPTAAAELAAAVDPFTVGVVGSSNFGNLDTVCRVADEIHAGGTSEISPMDLPNASSNVPAATVATWFGLRAVNLMLCSGATSGLDAMYMASTAIRSGRADIMVVVGVEVPSGPADRLIAEFAAGTPDVPAITDGAASVIVESVVSARSRRAPIRARLGSYGSGSSLTEGLTGLDDLTRERPTLWLTPAVRGAADAEAVRAAAATFPAGTPAVDVSALLGEWYGALGVAQCGLAAATLAAGRAGTAVVSCGPAWGDGSASLVLSAELARDRLPA